jgi:hypothetical protein
MNVYGLLVLMLLTLTMVALGWPALRPSRASVWAGVAGLALIPVLLAALLLGAWAAGR